MAISISVTNSPWQRQRVSLSGNTYVFVLRENTRLKDSAIYLDMYFEEEEIKTGIRLVQESPLIRHYFISDFDHGQLFILKNTDKDVPLTIETLGQDKEYSLIYISNDELTELQQA